MYLTDEQSRKIGPLISKSEVGVSRTDIQIFLGVGAN